jgi:6-pyruvoyltetrahydropterin/6-carboxytetrahydropterin synthase
MYELKIITQFAAAHHLRAFKGKCEQLHGHNWKVEVYIRASQTDEIGLVKDFGEIKAVTQGVLQRLDHTYLNDQACFQQENPSSENIARYLFRELSRLLDDSQARTSKVTVWESDTACASYWEEQG